MQSLSLRWNLRSCEDDWRKLFVMSRLSHVLAAAVLLPSVSLPIWAGEAPAAPPEAPKKIGFEEFQKMTPTERTNRMKELREKFEKMTPEQKEAQRKIMLGRLETQIAELKKKKEAGDLTEAETKRLEFLEQRLKLWGKVGKEGVKPPPTAPDERPRPAQE
jgi:hypothetical protein